MSRITRGSEHAGEEDANEVFASRRGGDLVDSERRELPEVQG